MTEPAQGAHLDDQGVRFSLFSLHAEAVELCLFDPDRPVEETRRVTLERDGADGLWRTRLPEVREGQLYGYRVHGPFDPSRGHRFNPAKLLLDPYAKAVAGGLEWRPEIHGFRERLGDTLSGDTDSAPFVPRSVVINDRFEWGDDRPPGTSWRDTVIYECHVRGLTRLLEEVPEESRGTYSGLAHPAVIEHLGKLGVTAVELMPVQHFVSEGHLQGIGLGNYWGYSPLALFAPHAAYATGDRGAQAVEFKQMVKDLHAAGLEVILDVVFNHTPEGDHHGPTLSLRGIDNAVYYLPVAGDRRLYADFTGCGNTLDMGQQQVLRLVLDCLRYWVCEMHVDGFRFDLAPVLGRRRAEFDPDAPFFGMLRDDPWLSRIKVIAEPWDVGPQGYKLGRFPGGWAEWNDRYRDALRAFWRGETGVAQSFMQSFAGSRDLFSTDSERGKASINFVTCHDGFTLADLVSYQSKHNWDNGEGNRDGHDHNLSRNWGVEGPTESPEVRHARSRAQRSLMATLALSWGVPMISHGDETGRTQRGNNNAYCQDNELTWVDWRLDREAEKLLRFCRRVFRLRRRLGLGQGLGPPAPGALTWISIDGRKMPTSDRPAAGALPFGALLRGRGDPLLIIFNGDRRTHLFVLPELEASGRWRQVINTHRPGARRIPGYALRVGPHSLVAAAFEQAAQPPSSGSSSRSIR